MHFEKNIEGSNDALDTYFKNTWVGKYVPRCVLIDLEPSVIDEVRTGFYNELFDAEQLISGKEDAANNYCRGYFTVGWEIIDHCMDKIKGLAE